MREVRGGATAVASCLLLALVLAAGCRQTREPVQLPPAAYRAVVTSFYTGLAAMQTSQDALARESFDRVTKTAPQEPAGWADFGLLLLRQQETEAAMPLLAKAGELAPDNGAIQRLLALSESRRGNLDASIAHWRKALEIDPDDAKAAYALAQETERQGGPDADAAAGRLLEALAARHDNLVARVDAARLAAKRGDAAALKAALAPLAAASSRWPEEVRARFLDVQQAAAGDPRNAATATAFLKNTLLRVPEYRRALAQVSTPREEVGEPLVRFLALPNPAPQPAAPDAGLTFTTSPVPGAPDQVGFAGAIVRNETAWPELVWADARSVSVGPARAAAFPGGALGTPPTGDGVVMADINYDYRTDLVLAGAGGLRLLRQNTDGRFADVTAATRLPAPVTRASYWGAWAADIDTEGDLDLVVAPVEGPVSVLRNNGDGTFAAQQPFGPVANVRGFVWADLDGEGVPDAALLDAAGTVHLFLNLRSGQFRALGGIVSGAVGLAVHETSGDALFDLVVLRRDGDIQRLAYRPDRPGWQPATLGHVTVPTGGVPGAMRLTAADVDNNGAADLLVAGPNDTTILLAGPNGSEQVRTGPNGSEQVRTGPNRSDRTRTDASPSIRFVALARTPGVAARLAVDLDRDGRLDLVGRGAGGSGQVGIARGTRPYHFQVLRPRSASVLGDQRINSFGIGGEVEVRTGLHVQQQIITSPIVHVGLGESTRAEVTRIVWPNGTIQSEFGLQAGATVTASQRLKGSCPWLFAWNGREMAWVTDLLWRSPLGLRINAQTTAGILMTEDWVKLRGDQLAPRDGAFDLRVTAELWETHFFDLVGLAAVDHPAGTEVFVDERFAVPSPRMDIAATGPVHPFAAATDTQGSDVSGVVGSRDDRHLGVGSLGSYQGIVADHFVELTLPESAPRHGPLWLIGRGWVHPTDSSINVAMSQNGSRPRALSLHVADAAGRFHEARTNLGFPSGKDKTVRIGLEGVFPATGPRKLRLATNLEIYWDALGWAAGRDDVPLAPMRLTLLTAELRPRGYSVTEQAAPTTPERPRYVLAGTAPRWRDLEGYHTRFGDVRPLLNGVDDRYVIMNAGDELALRFAAPPPPAPGFVRDFVVVSDGWEKDGDYNTTFSRTVLPLPTHASAVYDRSPGRLEDDPVYRAHREDFDTFHTRYVAPDRIREGLRTAQTPRR